MGLMVAIGKKGSDDSEVEEESREPAEETTAAQREAGKAFASAVKSGDGEAVWLAFGELCALHADEEEGEGEEY